MNKKDYYETLNKYEQIREQQDFNGNYSDKEEFENVKKELQKAFERFSQNLVFEASYIKSNPFRRDALLAHADKISVLSQKILAEESITENDYADTYYETKWFGFFTTKQLLLIAVIFAIGFTAYYFLH